MGISLLPARAVTREHRVLGTRQGLPPMDSFEIALLHRPAAEPIILDLAAQFVRLLDSERR